MLSVEAGKPTENKPFPVLSGPKEDQGHLGKTGAQGPQGARREKGQDGTGTSGLLKNLLRRLNEIKRLNERLSFREDH